MTSTAMPATWKPVPTALAACLKSIARLQICQNSSPAIFTLRNLRVRSRRPGLTRLSFNLICGSSHGMRNELYLELTRYEIYLCESRSSRHSPAHAPRPPNPSVRRKRHESALNRVMGPTALLLVNALKTGSLPRRLSIAHSRHSADPGVIFIPIPRRTTYVQMGVRRAGEHHHRASVPHHGAKPSGLRIERPEDHPMGTDRDRGTGGAEGIRVAVLRCSIEHVDQTRRRVGRLWLPCHHVLHPHHSHRVEAHVHAANDVLVAGDTDPVVCPLA